jgi:hypothetical protein
MALTLFLEFVGDFRLPNHRRVWCWNFMTVLQFQPGRRLSTGLTIDGLKSIRKSSTQTVSDSPD